MAVNLTNADSALKSFYLDAVTEQLNEKVNPFLAQIRQTTDDVWGKEVKKLVIHGVNGGIGAGTEDGNLPTAQGNGYSQFTTTLKNLYGTIEITDKAIRASENNSGAFVSLLNSEMNGLINSSNFNFGRMLFGDGNGYIGKVVSVSSGIIVLDSVRNLVEGMVVDFVDDDEDPIASLAGRKILAVDRESKAIKISGATVTSTDLPADSQLYIQGSYGNELSGLEHIFGNSTYLYGLKRTDNLWADPYVKYNVGSISENILQKTLDKLEERGGDQINFIICSWGVRRALQALFATNRSFVETMELKGGFKAMSYNGIPIIADRFCPEGTMYFLNTNDFALHQLCDWQWLEGDDGRILKQVAGKPVYTATLVKYADLVCSKPYAQGKLCGITEA